MAINLDIDDNAPANQMNRVKRRSRRALSAGFASLAGAALLAGCATQDAVVGDSVSPTPDTGTCINCTQVTYNGKAVNALFVAAGAKNTAWFTMETPESKDQPTPPVPDPSPTALTQAIGFASQSGGNPAVTVLDLTPWLSAKGISAGTTWSVAASPKNNVAYIGMFGTKPKPDGTADTKGYVLKVTPKAAVPTLDDVSLFATMDEAFTAVTPAAVGQPYGLSVDNNDSLYITDIQNDQIERLPATFSGDPSQVSRFPVPKNAPPDPCQTSAPHGGVDGLTDFAAAPDGSIGYATAKDSSSVYKIDLKTAKVDTIPFVDPVTGISGKPSWVTMAPGNVPFFTYSGGVAPPTGSPSATPSCATPTVTPTPSGSSTDSGGRGGDGIAYINDKGAAVFVGAGTAEGANYLGVTASPNGEVYTASLENSQVLALAAKNPTPGLAPIALFTTGQPGPWGLSPNGDGSQLWVTYKNIGYIGYVNTPAPK